MPFFIKVPGMKPTESNIAVTGADIYPTVVDLLGLATTSHQVDGTSLHPILAGTGKLAKRPLYWHYPHYGNQGGEPSSIIMEDDWKLIYYHEDQRYELYNITKDVGERVDLLQAEPERAKAMQVRLAKWLQETSARLPKEDPQFDNAKREARWETLRTTGKERLERQHAHFLDEDFQPGEDWWGSAPSE